MLVGVDIHVVSGMDMVVAAVVLVVVVVMVVNMVCMGVFVPMFVGMGMGMGVIVDKVAMPVFMGVFVIMLMNVYLLNRFCHRLILSEQLRIAYIWNFSSSNSTASSVTWRSSINHR
jgi:hypothetical protein